MNVSKAIDSSMTTHVNTPKTTQQDTQKKTTTLASDNVDKLDSNSAYYNKNYNQATNKSEYANVQQYKGSTLQIKNALMQDYVNFNIGGQAGSSFNPFFGNNSYNSTYSSLPFALNAFNTAEETSSKYDDYWGVDAVADRIFTFAKSLAGDNDELFETMKNAFLKGFNLASGSRNDSLPEISYQTKDKVLELFDAWESEIAERNAGS